MELVRDGEVFVLHMRRGENRFNREFVDEFQRVLDEVEASEGPAALVTTGEGKFYSNGLDLEWMIDLGPSGAGDFLLDVDRLWARLLVLPMATAAAINGHAFAAGGMLSLAHDFRVMRADRGFFCLPEIDLAMGQPLSDGMYALIGTRLSRATFHDALVSGRRYGGADAASNGIVHEVRPAEEVLSAAVERVRPLAAKDRATMAALKRGLHREALAVLESPNRTG